MLSWLEAYQIWDSGPLYVVTTLDRTSVKHLLNFRYGMKRRFAYCRVWPTLGCRLITFFSQLYFHSASLFFLILTLDIYDIKKTLALLIVPPRLNAFRQWRHRCTGVFVCVDVWYADADPEFDRRSVGAKSLHKAMPFETWTIIITKYFFIILYRLWLVFCDF